MQCKYFLLLLKEEKITTWKFIQHWDDGNELYENFIAFIETHKTYLCATRDAVSVETEEMGCSFFKWSVRMSCYGNERNSSQWRKGSSSNRSAKLISVNVILSYGCTRKFWILLSYIQRWALAGSRQVLRTGC